MLLPKQSLLAILAGCLLAFAASEAQAQRGGARQPGGGMQRGATQGGGMQAGGTGATREGIATAGSAFDGEISRSADRVLSDVGVIDAAGGAMPGRGMGAGARGMGGMGAMGGGMGAFGASPFGAGGAAAQPPSIRTRLRADIQIPPQQIQVNQARVQRQINAAPMQRLVNGFSVSIRDGVATMVGTAPTERDRRMAELVLRLEPGVRQINNQIVVAQ
jgi:hypothetical protein